MLRMAELAVSSGHEAPSGAAATCTLIAYAWSGLLAGAVPGQGCGLTKPSSAYRAHAASIKADTPSEIRSQRSNVLASRSAWAAAHGTQYTVPLRIVRPQERHVLSGAGIGCVLCAGNL